MLAYERIGTKAARSLIGPMNRTELMISVDSDPGRANRIQQGVRAISRRSGRPSTSILSHSS